MSYFGSTDWYERVSAGQVPGHSIVHKFGAGELTTTFAPVTNSGFYRTPTAVVTLEVVSSSANDTAAGTGAQQVTITGLNISYDEVDVVVELNGTTAVALGTDLLRVYRWRVSRTGSYGSQTVGAHDGSLTLRVSGGGDTWATLTNTPFPTGQSQIGCYTLPRNKKAYLLSKNIFVDSTKSADLYFFKRENADDVTTPYTGIIKLVEREVGITGGYALKTISPKYLGVGPMDVGFMGILSAGTGECSVEFELLIVDL